MTKIIGREVSPSNMISWVPAEGSFPMKHSISGNRLGGALALLIGSVWVYYFLDHLFTVLQPTPLLPDLLMIILVTLPGIFILAYGISQYFYYEETTIDQNSVQWKRRGLSGNHEWREAISSYRGVLKEHKYWDQEDVSNHSSYMIYLIRLTHADPAKEVVLFRTENSILVPPAAWNEKWKLYAELFKLPVLERTESGITSSEVGDLDEPLVNKIRNGKRTVIDMNPLEAKLGLMAKLTRDGDLWLITCYPVWNAWKSIVGIVVLAAALMGAYIFKLIDPRVFKYFLLFVPLCLFAIGLSIRKHVAHPEQLALDKRGIYYRYWNKQKGWTTDTIPLLSIYNLSVKSNPMHFRSAGEIVIEEKNRIIRFGWWLPKKTKLRIESLLLSLIAR